MGEENGERDCIVNKTANGGRRLTLKETALHCVLLFAVVVLVFPRVVFLSEIPLPGDVLYNFPPWKSYTPDNLDVPKDVTSIEAITQYLAWAWGAKQALQGGEWPLWNPYQTMGVPLMANFQSAVFYPFKLFPIAGDLYIGTAIYMLSKLFLCGLTAYIFARGIGLGVPASRFLSFAWMLGGYVTLWLYWQLGDVAIWLPIVFLGADRIAVGRLRGGFYTLALGGALILLAGHPETALTMSAGVGMYFVLRLVLLGRFGKPFWFAAGTALAAWAVALLVCAVQLVPFFEYLFNSYTIEARASGDAPTHFMKPESALGLLIPRFFGASAQNNFWGHENSNFTAIFYPLMAVWAGVVLFFVGVWRRDIEIRWAVCLFTPVAVGLLLAFNVPPFNVVNRLPILESMWGMYHAAFTVFALPLAAAVAVDAWWRQDRPQPAVPFAFAMGVAGLTVVGAMVWLRDDFPNREMVYYAMVRLVVGLTMFGVTAYLFCARRFEGRRRLAAALLLMVLMGDSMIAHDDVLRTAPRERLLFETELTETLRAIDEPHRVSAASAGIPGGVMQLYNIEHLWGYDGIFPSRVMTFLERGNECNWQGLEPLCNLQYYLFPEGSPPPAGALTFVQTVDGIDLYKNEAALPRAFLARSLHHAETDNAVFDRLCRDDFDPSEAAVTTKSISSPLNGGAEGGNVAITDRSFNSVSLRVQTPRPAVLVLTETYFPGWRVTVNGAERAVIPVNHAFRGVIVPKGTHRVRFEYDPMSFRIGLIVSGVAMLCSIAAASRHLWRRRTASAF